MAAAAESESTLWRLEEGFWKGGEEFYRRNLTEHALMVLPEMVLTADAAIQAVKEGPRWSAVTFTERRETLLGDEIVALTYRVAARRDGDSDPYAALATSVYLRNDGKWKLALHQQTPVRDR